MNNLRFLWWLFVVFYVAGSVALAQTGTGSIIQPVIDALDGAGDGVLGPLGILLGVLATVSIGFAIVRTIRS